MAAKNQVTLTFAGEGSQLKGEMDSIGAGAKEMGDDVGSAAKGFDNVGEAADRGETRILGAKDAVDGVATIMKGPGEQGIAAYIQGWADLSSGVANFLIPATKALFTTGLAAAKMKITAAATKAWTAAQWLLNVALSANPIGIVVAALVALGAILVVAWTRSERFRQIVTGAFSSVLGWAKRNWPLLLGILTGPIGLAVLAFVKYKDRIIGVFKAIPDAFRAAINWVIDRWNGLQFTLPSFKAFGKTFGGFTVGTPDIPRLHAGGFVPGAPGQEHLAILQSGEEIKSNRGGSDGRTVLELRSSGSRLDDLLLQVLANAIQVRGGNVQLILGGRP